MKIKICGITREADARMVSACGVDYIGLNFWPKSSRFVTNDQARKLRDAVKSVSETTQVVGLFVNQAAHEVETIVSSVGLDWIQFHGDESETFVRGFKTPTIKAHGLLSDADVSRALSFESDMVLVDTPSVGYGGSGRVGDWTLASKVAASERPVFLAGGLRAENVCDAMSAVRPYGIDLASGVESSPGIKDEALVKALIEKVRTW